MQTGRLHIRLHVNGSQVVDAGVDLARPTVAPRLLIGRTAEETPALVGQLFSLCSTAQTCASLKAVETAIGHRPSPATEAMRAILVAAEAAEQNALRVCVDWPSLTGGTAHIDGYRSIHAAVRRLVSVVAPNDAWKTPMHPLPRVDIGAPLADLRHRLDKVLGPALNRYLEKPRDGEAGERTDVARALVHIATGPQASMGQTQIAPLLREDFVRLQETLADPDGGDAFAARPEVDGRAAETGPFARRRRHRIVDAALAEAGPGLLARLMARLAALYEAPSQMARIAEADAGLDPPLPQIRAGSGLGLVTCARGLLAHWVAVEDDRLTAYRIVAPTEWNFHPQGVVRQGLLTIRGATEAQIIASASLWVTAIDPCLAYKIEVVHV